MADDLETVTDYLKKLIDKQKYLLQLVDTQKHDHEAEKQKYEASIIILQEELAKCNKGEYPRGESEAGLLCKNKIFRVVQGNDLNLLGINYDFIFNETRAKIKHLFIDDQNKIILVIPENNYRFVFIIGFTGQCHTFTVLVDPKTINEFGNSYLDYKYIWAARIAGYSSGQYCRDIVFGKYSMMMFPKAGVSHIDAIWTEEFKYMVERINGNLFIYGMLFLGPVCIDLTTANNPADIVATVTTPSRKMIGGPNTKYYYESSLDGNIPYCYKVFEKGRNVLALYFINKHNSASLDPIDISCPPSERNGSNKTLILGNFKYYITCHKDTWECIRTARGEDPNNIGIRTTKKYEWY